MPSNQFIAAFPLIFGDAHGINVTFIPGAMEFNILYPVNASPNTQILIGGIYTVGTVSEGGNNGLFFSAMADDNVTALNLIGYDSTNAQIEIGDLVQPVLFRGTEFSFSTGQKIPSLAIATNGNCSIFGSLFVPGGVFDASATGMTFDGFGNATFAGNVGVTGNLNVTGTLGVTGQATFAQIPVTPVKVFRALVTQNGTNPPTMTILENSLGGVPVWSYNLTGNYVLTLAGAFSQNKTFCTCQSSQSSTIIQCYCLGTGNDIAVKTQVTNGNMTDSALEILVYP